MADATMSASRHRPSLRHRLEAVLAGLFLALFRQLSIASASGFAGVVARTIGPHVGVSRRARTNLARAMPDLSRTDIDRIVRNMWDNLGRVAGEMPHLDAFEITASASAPGQIEVVGQRHLDEALNRETPLLMFAGHIANWDIQALTTYKLAADLSVVYRSANNPLVDEMIKRMRGPLASDTIPKGTSGARQLIRLMQQGRPAGMLVDQKMNDGIAVPFFGRPAMTAPALAQLALRFNATVLPVHCERLGGARFRVTFEAPLPLPKTGDRTADTLTLMTQVNRRLENWIRQRPEQWLWLHRRWPD